MARKTNSDKDIVVPSGAAAAQPRRNPTLRPKHSSPAAEVPATPARSAETEAPSTASAELEPSHEQIARLAYLLWEARGCQGGCPEEDWLSAEQELRRSPVTAQS